MAAPIQEIVPAQYAPAAQTTLYTSPQGVATRIDKLSVTNVTASASTISMSLVPYGASAGIGNQTTNNQTIMPGQTFNSPNEYGHYLNPGDALSVVAGTANALVIAVGGTLVAA